MPISVVILLTSVAAFWLFGHFAVKRRFTALKSNLPDIYRSAIAVPPEEGETPRLVALCIDLMRKQHCTDPFDSLSVREQKMALHAHAVEALPGWMSRYAALGLTPRNRALIAQMRHVKASQPAQKAPVYYGAVKRQQQLRRAPKP